MSLLFADIAEINMAHFAAHTRLFAIPVHLTVRVLPQCRWYLFAANGIEHESWRHRQLWERHVRERANMQVKLTRITAS